MADIHERRCFVCGHIQVCAERITPYITCEKCKSNDTRATKRVVLETMVSIQERDAAIARAEAAEASLTVEKMESAAALDALRRANQRIAELESGQDTHNPVSQVYFRAGLLAARESLARFVEFESPTIAASIRANWWPRLGDDPGPPRQFQWDEIAQENSDGSITHKPISPSVEAVAYAWAFLEGQTDG